MMNGQVPVWLVMMPTDQQADHGSVSHNYMVVSLWLKDHYPYLTVAEKAPVDWRNVHAVLSPLVCENESFLPLRQVVSHLGQGLGIPVPC
jgi:hypothetical protein